MSATDASSSLDAVVTPPDVDDLYRRHGNWLVAFLRRRFSRQDAEDLAQETYVRTVGAKTYIRDPRNFLAKVALHAAQEIAESRANRLVLCVVEDADAAVPSEQDELLCLKQLVMSLPADLKVVFVMSRFAGLTNEEIAERCGVSVKRVEARMTKARAKLAAMVRD